MKSRNILLNLVLFLAILLTACGGAAGTDAMVEEKESMSEEPMPQDSHDNAMAEPTHDVMMDDSMSTPEAMMSGRRLARNRIPIWRPVPEPAIYTDCGNRPSW